jgi:monovalent cation/hydrogen antiporter
MHQAETVVVLFASVAALVLISRKLAVPYPIVLVIAGLGLSFIPRLPEVRLNPDIVFYFFLPPLIYPAALFTSWRDFRRELRPIASLSFGLVLATVLAVAWMAHALVPAMPWPAAFAFGAIASPTDAIAATSVIRRLSLPNRIEVVLEGESLVNDATALVALQFAVAALMTGSFSLGAAAARFVLVVVGGIALGLLVGLLMRWIHRLLDDPPVQITLSLLTPFIAYLPAERLHLSGILAVVAAGIFLGWHSPVIVTARYRLQAFAFWEMVVFLLNGFIFIIIGLQLPGILHGLRGESLVRLITDGVLVSAIAVLVRIAWVFPATYLPRFVSKRIRQREPSPGWRNVTVVAWCGMRGVISLAAAFALPFSLSNGAAFPARNYILFLTFCIIFSTLVLQGLTLPVLIKLFGIKPDTAIDEEERAARVEANKAALELIGRVSGDGFAPHVVDRLRTEYEERLEQLRISAETAAERSGEVATREYVQLQQQALQRERETIIRLRNHHFINDAALRRIQRDLDLAEARLAAG